MDKTVVLSESELVFLIVMLEGAMDQISEAVPYNQAEPVLAILKPILAKMKGV